MGRIININPDTPKDGENNPQKKIADILLDKAAEMEYKLFVQAVRTKAVPPIKGRLTKKKLEEAGIVRCFNEETMESWLEQRGDRISEIFRIVWK